MATTFYHEKLNGVKLIYLATLQINRISMTSTLLHTFDLYKIVILRASRTMKFTKKTREIRREVASTNESQTHFDITVS